MHFTTTYTSYHDAAGLGSDPARSFHRLVGHGKGCVSERCQKIAQEDFVWRGPVNLCDREVHNFIYCEVRGSIIQISLVTYQRWRALKTSIYLPDSDS